MNYILPARKKMESNLNGKYQKTVAVIIHLHYLEGIEFYLQYIKRIPEYIDLVFTYSNEKVSEALQIIMAERRGNFKIIKKKNRGRDISALLVACRYDIVKYDYICFLHDKREKYNYFKTDVENWVNSLWENMIGSTEYIENVLYTFETNSELGLLVPPFPMTEHFSCFYNAPWGKNFNMTKILAVRMGLNCDLDQEKPPIALGTVFWARTCSLKKLFNIEWKYEDFDEEPRKNDGTISHAIERILPYVAQDAGFDTGWVMTDCYASERFEYMQEVLKNAFYRLDNSLGITWIAELNSYENRVREVMHFVEQYDFFYIFGAGVNGKRKFAMLKNMYKLPRAFLVSDSDMNPKCIHNIPVYGLSEVELNDRCGVIVGVGAEKQQEVIQKIKNRNPHFSNIFIDGNSGVV